MSDFYEPWNISRTRFVDTISDLNDEQLNWRIHPKCLTIGEMAMHVAGVEVSFASQLSGATLDEHMARVKASATDGVVNDRPFPFAASEITKESVAKTLAEAKAMSEPLLIADDPAIRKKEIVSALGPVITGAGAFARWAFHAGYHQGQAYLIRTDPRFPAS